MPGTIAGNKKTVKAVKEIYGEDYYKIIGSKGGKALVPKGFALMDTEKLKRVSSKGGSVKGETKRRKK